MAQLKAGSTANGVLIKSTAGPWNYPEMDFATGSGLSEGFIKKSLSDEFELVLTASDNVKPQAVGTVAGFTSGGGDTPGTNIYSTIDRFPFTSPFTTATNVGSLTQARYDGSGQSSSTEAFTSGGFAPPTVSTIDKFTFSLSPVTSASAGALSTTRSQMSGQSSITEGFTAGDGSLGTIIDKFPFTAPFTTASSAGNLSTGRSLSTGHSSLTEGFSAGGFSTPSAFTTSIEKFPFSAPFTTATSAGALSQARGGVTGQSSFSNGYTSGGFAPGAPPAPTALIDRFPFTAPFTTATNVGNLSQSRTLSKGQSSTTDGYTSGGGTPTQVATIDRFPFAAAPLTTTNVGSLSQARTRVSAGHQY